MPYTQHFIVEGAYLGSAVRGRLSVTGGTSDPQPYAFFCGSCAELWARCPVDKLSPSIQQEWMVWRRPCRRCAGHSGEIPGSLLLPWEEDFNNCLAEVPDALRWEFQQHLTFAERHYR
jgi:hypothetical protein